MPSYHLREEVGTVVSREANKIKCPHHDHRELSVWNQNVWSLHVDEEGGEGPSNGPTFACRDESFWCEHCIVEGRSPFVA